MEEKCRYFAFRNQEDWDEGVGFNLRFDDGQIVICQEEKYVWQETLRLGRIVPARICDFAPRLDGRFYLLDEQTNVWVYDPKKKHRERLFSEGHRLFTADARIAAAGEQLIVADRRAKYPLAMFSTSGQICWTMTTWREQPIVPLALTAGRRALYLLTPRFDRGAPDGKASSGTSFSILQIDFAGPVLAEWRFCQGEERQERRHDFSGNPFHLAVDQQGGLCLFDRPSQAVTVFTKESAPEGRCFPIENGKMAAFTVDHQGKWVFIKSRSASAEKEMARVGEAGLEEEPRAQGRDNDRDDEIGGTMLVYSAQGKYQETLSDFVGHGDRLVLGKNAAMYLLDSVRRELHILRLQNRTERWAATGAREGCYVSAAIDSGKEGTLWHRVAMDARIPEETQVRFSFFCSDSPEAGPESWAGFSSKSVPSPPQKDSLLQIARRFSRPIINSGDALLTGAQGRYLWFRLELAGTREASPVVRGLRIYFPRVTSLLYLPAIYQEDRESGDFLARFLSLFDTLLEEVQENIKHSPRILDGQVAAGDHLRWLAGWLGIGARQGWTDGQIRQVMARAPQMYRYRGTRRVVEDMLEIFTGARPLIVEYFQYKPMLESVTFQRLFLRLYSDNPYCFCVILKGWELPSDQERAMAQQIIDEQKPAFTEAKLILLERWMILGSHTYLGINSYLSQPTALVLDERGSLPFHTLLLEDRQDGRLGGHTRLEVNTELA
ncbi:hypothetical protein GTO89_14810 [Heliobacterium gestii]|uniref:Phage tail protein n=1 Tax=Heliomicrobium gestii TaxID=2699 RepID=A0A845LLQ5_HELGE|nr:phage tail protein [Heliomicrobium gestii]MBM7868037.1 phage tail-like protein [Heliomicrobium gestii]MZP44303.1 hypothetical protein [Heliomicrobium gestii]